MQTCARCGRQFDYPPGRGGRSPYCETCKAERRVANQQLRSLRHSLTTLSEWIDAVGPTVIQWKQEVVARQDGKCLRCGRAVRLYLARDEAGLLIALCQDDHDSWREEQKSSDGRDSAAGGGGDDSGSELGDGAGARRREPAGAPA